jgi:hypothetical protein
MRECNNSKIHTSSKVLFSIGLLIMLDDFIVCISGNDSERGKSSEYHCSVLLDGSREKVYI